MESPQELRSPDNLSGLVPAWSELQARYDAAGKRLLAAQQEKIEAVADFLAVRDNLEKKKSEQADDKTAK